VRSPLWPVLPRFRALGTVRSIPAASIDASSTATRGRRSARSLRCRGPRWPGPYWALLNVHSVLYTGHVQAHQRQTRSEEAILDAAETAFAEAGYDGATFSTICQRAGVSRGLPSYLFGNKEDLYRHVVQRAAGRLRDAVIEPLRKRAASASIAGALTQIVGTYIDYLARNRQVVRLLQWEMLSEPIQRRPYAPTSALFAEVLEILESVLVKNGRLDIQAPALLGSVVALCFFPFTVNNRVPAFGKLTVAERKRNIVALLARGLAKKRSGRARLKAVPNA
jgi:TetR/AcrR family transcriptional regulator